MKIQIISISLMLLLSATLLPGAESQEASAYNTSGLNSGKVTQGEYDIEVVGNFLGYYVTVRHLGEKSRTQNDTLLITVTTNTDPPWVIFLGETLELEPPIPQEEETHHIGPLFGLGQTLITVEVLLIMDGDEYWNSAETSGFVLLFFTLCDDIHVPIPY